MTAPTLVASWSHESTILQQRNILYRQCYYLPEYADIDDVSSAETSYWKRRLQLWS
jgi:hypothetical protein